MVIDSSAIVAVLLEEPECESFIDAVLEAAVVRISAATFVEASMILESRRGAEGILLLDRWIEEAGIEIAAVDSVQARIVRQAFSDFGKGRHRAGLNFGDCFSYALAKRLGEPLLSKGNDFPYTDLPLADLRGEDPNPN